MTSRTLLTAILLVATANAAAQEFPTKPIRILVGFTPGGGADIAARFVAQKFTETWARPAVVDNRPGAGGNVAFDLTAKAPADGHTLIVAPGPFAPGLYAKLPFDLRKDLVAVTQIARAPMILVVHPSVPAGPRSRAARHPDVWILGAGPDTPSRHRAIERHGKSADRTHSLQGRRTRDARCRGRARRHVDYLGAHRDRTDQERATQGARRHFDRSRAPVPRCADR